MKKKNVIVVNATALRSGGGLTILRQFIDTLPEDDVQYIVFADESVTFSNSKKNLRIIPRNVVPLFKRFMWDVSGLKKWLKKNNIRPAAAVSLQNTNFRVPGKCPNYIYYHQPIPLYSHKWSLLKRQERPLWFYRNIYTVFVKLLINPRTEIFVQLNFIKDAFALRFSFPENKIHVVFPKVKIPAVQNNYKFPVDSNNLNLFYPATGEIYKNHEILFKSRALTDSRLRKKVILFLTIGEKDLKRPENIKNAEIVFLGRLSHDEVLWLFSKVDALIFPSYIETLGLPLIEAASFGLPVIVSDLPYAREALSGYEGATYVDFRNPASWGDAIMRLSATRNKRYNPYRKEEKESWHDFFRIIEKDLIETL